MHQINNYQEYPLNTKSYAINCIAHLLSPEIILSADQIFCFDLFEIILDHLNLFFHEDQMNLFFIIRSLIIIGNHSEYESQLRDFFWNSDVIELLEEILYDESQSDINNEFIENIRIFMNQ